MANTFKMEALNVIFRPWSSLFVNCFAMAQVILTLIVYLESDYIYQLHLVK